MYHFFNVYVELKQSQVKHDNVVFNLENYIIRMLEHLNFIHNHSLSNPRDIIVNFFFFVQLSMC